MTNGVRVVASPFRAGACASSSASSSASELTYPLTGQPLYYVGDVVFRSGRLLGSVFPERHGRHRAACVDPPACTNSLASRIRRVDSG
jgi:hypothetical protein